MFLAQLAFKTINLFHRNQFSPVMSRRILGVSFQWTYPSLCVFIPHLHLKQKSDLLEVEKMLGQTVPTAHFSQHIAPQVRVNWPHSSRGRKPVSFPYCCSKWVPVIIPLTFLLSQVHVSTYVCSPYQGKRTTCAGKLYLLPFSSLLLSGPMWICDNSCHFIEENKSTKTTRAKLH